MKNFILSFLLLLFSFTRAFAADPVSDFINSKGVSPASTAVLVRDLSTGETLVSHNASLPLVPASILKTVSIASLLSESGSDSRFHTRVLIDGKVKSGVLDGSLIIKGGGDPTLGADCDPQSDDIMQEIISALKSKGIKEIRGGIKIDTSYFSGPACPPSWAAGDLSASYGTGCHALNFLRNKSGKSAIKDPENLFLSRLRHTLENAGMTVDGECKVGGKDILNSDAVEILDHVSDTYAEVMRSCMMRSDNLFAESILRTFGIARGGDGSTSDGAAEEMKYWASKGFPMENVHIVDGSGLSRSNRVTADFINAMLVAMKDNEDYASFMPLAGQEGTLSDFLKDTPLDSYVAMKTGSMNGIQCYAGYKLDERFAPTHSIVIIMNDIGNRSAVRASAQRLLLTLFPNS